MKAKLFYIGERRNPQFKKPYYTPLGQLTKRQAKDKEDCLYGSNFMLPFETEVEYNNAIEKFKTDGFNVH